MKKLLLVTLVSVSLFSCSKENSLISDMKSEFKKYELPNFNDPKSFEEVEAKIVDTTFQKDYLIKELNDRENGDGLFSLNRPKDKLNEWEKNRKEDVTLGIPENVKIDDEEITKWKKEYDSNFKWIGELKTKINNTSKDEIRFINLIYKIRGKNAMGGLILKEIKVSYTKETYNDIQNKVERHFDFDYGEDKFKN